MARPKTTAGTTPAPIRSAKSKASLLKVGGRRTTINLPPETNAQIAALMPGHGGEKAETKAVIIAAVDALWRAEFAQAGRPDAAGSNSGSTSR
jgi:hypothetical protein